MTKPFPGMDPYLEGYLWPDFHQALANKIRQALAPQIQPKYVARLEISMQDQGDQASLGGGNNDVELLKIYHLKPVPAPTGGVNTVAEVLPTLSTQDSMPLPRIRIVNVEIRDASNNTLVTSIEILSPINKSSPGLEQYRQKRQWLRTANVHLLEIDLLRGGQRLISHPRLADFSYLITMVRAQSEEMGIWPIRLIDELPTVPVPLRYPDSDILLNFSKLVSAVYEEAFYQLSIDYDEAPPPPIMNEQQMIWLYEHTHKKVIPEKMLKLGYNS
ncbi:DUF4058 family protein [Anaerolineales bacterium HSG6]|nr:DUF4058 family protein [Anaerolineales bacterium HSG6]MDM8532365.1 DUF4058 family protein [Anaerolineales bacterium HSG25]